VWFLTAYTPGDFEGVNWFRFLIEIFRKLSQLAGGMWDFLHYEIPLRMEINLGLFSFSFPPAWLPFHENIPTAITMWELLGGTAIIGIMLLVLIKYIIPML